MRKDYLGFVDAVRHRTVFGWAHDRCQPDRPPVLRIQINGTDAGLAIADRPRADLQTLGIMQPRGFEWTVPDTCPNIEAVKVLTVDGDIELPHSSESIVCKTTNRCLPPEWINGHHHLLPSFFILGAAKSGTTSLHGYLGQHPEICVSEPKEPFFFEAEFDLGAAYYFARYFSHWRGQRVVGEARHRNLYVPYAAQRIYQFNPDARLIVCLRNPVERAISHWWHWFSRDQEPLPLGEAIEQDWRRIQAGVNYASEANRGVYARTLDYQGKGILRTYLDSGWYYQQLQPYLRLFPREQFRFILFDDLIQDSPRHTAALLKFLDADPAYASRIDYEVLNRSTAGMLNRVAPETLTWLVQHYRPHNQLLSRLLGRNLDHWDAPFGARGAVHVLDASQHSARTV